jgi:hypothetical protein
MPLQNALAVLAPRNAGDVTIEPVVAFDTVEEALSAANRCPATCGPCTQGTEFCVHTGHTV